MIQFFIISLFFSCNFLKLFQIFAIGSYGVTTLDIVFIFVFFYIIYKHFWLNEPLYFVKNNIIFFVGLFLVCAILSAFNPILTTSKYFIFQYFKTAIHFFYLVLLFSYFSLIIIDLKIWNNFFKFMLITSIPLNIYAIYQLFARMFDLPWAYVKITNVSMLTRGAFDNIDDVTQIVLTFENFYRATSIFSEPSALAGFNLYILVIIIVPFYIGGRHFLKSNFLNSFIFILSLIATFLTFSLTASSGLFFIIVCMIFLERINKQLIIKSLFYLTIMIFILIAFDNYLFQFTNIKVTDLFYQRIATTLFKSKEIEGIVGESFHERGFSFWDSIEIWLHYPIIGIGLGTTSLNNLKAMAYSQFTSTAILVEMGIIGFITYVCFFYSLVYNSLKVRILILKVKYNNHEFDYNTLGRICIYIILLQLFFNFVTSNLLVSEASWMILMFVASIIHNIQIKNNIEVYKFKFLKNSYKEKLSCYLKSKSI